MDDQHLFEQFHAAYDIEPRAGSYELMRATLMSIQVRRRPRLWWRLQLPQRSVRLLVAALLVALALASAGAFIAINQYVHQTIPAHPGAGSVVVPISRMFTPTTGWGWTASLSPAPVWRTTDGGRSWTDVSPPTLPDLLYDPGNEVVYFRDSTHAWVVETGQSAPLNSSVYIQVFRTTDGGRTWREGAPITGLHPYGSLNPQLNFYDADRGWLLVWTESAPHVAEPILFSTNDGGLNWDLAARLADTQGACLSIPTFVSVSTGWLVAQSCGQGVPSLLVTHDGGATWEAQALPVTPQKDSYFDPPVFFNATRGFLVLHGSQPSLLMTSDGGSTWNARSLPGEFQLEVDFVDSDHGWAIAGSSSELGKFPSNPTETVPLYRTNDGGRTWVLVPTDLPLDSQTGRVDSLYFVDLRTGFATRSDSYGTSQFLRTTDGGRTWTLVAARRNS